MIRPKCLAAVVKDIATPVVHYAWAKSYHVAQRVSMPVILTAILVTEKLDQEFEDQISDQDF